MNYSQLVAPKGTANSIKAWLNWGLAPSEDILAEAETYLYGKLRVREMKQLATGTIAENATTLAAPTYYLSPISFRRIGENSGRIRILDSEHMEGRNAIDSNGALVAGVPTECQIIDGSPAAFHFNCKANADYPYRLVYYGRKAPLSADNQTNFLTNRYPKLLRVACLMEGWDYYSNPERSRMQENRLEKLIYEANAEHDIEQQAYQLEMSSEDER